LKESKKSSEEEIQEFFEEKLNKSGYALQTAVENKLSKARFETSREVYYVDKDESKGRPMDLASWIVIPDERIFKNNGRYVAGQLRLVIECKQLPDHAWVFFPSKLPAFSLPESVSLTEKQTPNPAFNYFPYVNQFIGLPFAGGFAEFLLPKKETKAKSKSNEKDNNLYEAVMTVTKATRHSIESTKTLTDRLMRIYPPRTTKSRILLFAIFQPVIVFKGRMYEASQEQEKLKLKPIKYVQIPKNYVSKNYEEALGQIHIVSYDSFDEYLEMLLRFYNERAQLMTQDQNKLLGLVDALKI
jgi:hypothetical protein